MRVIKVKSISDYLTKIKKYNLTDSICRGESSYHESINSGLFRNNYPRKVSSITQQYYNLVGNSLSELQRKHFVAFSQHYGIPTNLIDFSTSPLVALYFACQNTEKSSNGYVHFIKENKLIDISDKIDFINGKNYFGQILAFSENNLDLTVDLIRKIEDMCLINFDEDTDFLKSAISQYASMAISAQFTMENEDYYPRIDFCEIDFDTDYNTIIQKVLAQSSNVLGKAECAFLDRVFRVLIIQ